MATTLRFYYDIVCPFAYVASRQVKALARQAGLGLEYRPVLLGGIYQGTGSHQDPGSQMPAPKQALTRLDAMRQAGRAQLPFTWSPLHPQRTVRAMRLLLAVDPDRLPAMTDALYRAYWVDGRDLTDPAVLQDVAEPFDLDVDAVNADPAVRQRLFDRTAQAVEAGVFGVPTFELDGRLWWGADRMDLIREFLGIEADSPEPTLGPSAGASVAFFHDFSSPFSYLASTQVELVAKAGHAQLERVPFLLGALFKQIGTPLVPIDTFVQARRDYQLRDMQEWAKFWGVALNWPSHFPFRTVTALRAAIVEPGATDALYRAAWVEDRDLSDPEVIRGVLDDAGHDGATLLERAGSAEVKQQLFANTARAVAVGCCGAPSFLVNERHLFWGQDKLPMVSDVLAGWEPPTG